MGKMQRQKGYRWELACRKYFNRWLSKRTVAGTDLPDIELDIEGLKVIVECKDQQKLDFSGWLRQADSERRQANADLAIVCAKRRGKAMVGSAYVVMTADDFQWLLTQLELKGNNYGGLPPQPAP